MGTFLLKCHRCAIPFNSPEIWEVMIEKGVGGWRGFH